MTNLVEYFYYINCYSFTMVVCNSKVDLYTIVKFLVA